MEGRDRKRRFAASGLMAALLCLPLLSCGDGEAFGYDPSEEERDNICFSISDGIRPSMDGGDGVATRGIPVTESNFHNSFHVLAHRTTNGTLAERLFMDVDATKDGSGIWNTSTTYYWPGAEHSLKFYAWAPADVFTSVPTTSASTMLGYTVPDKVAGQKDLVVAVTGDVSGNSNSAVPLTFKHVCTAVSFQVGSRMQPGIIKSVALKGVKSVGTYDMASETWTLDGTTADFSQVISVSLTGNETEGTQITPAGRTFMMLPQVLPAGAKMVVEFESSVTGETLQLEASIAGGEWKMGIPMVYKLSITPELEIEVPTTSQDAHYITFPVTVHVKRHTGDWELTSNMPSDVFFTATKTNLQTQGYWIDEDKGSPTVTGTGTGDFTYHVYVTENVTDAARDIEFQLKSMVSGVTTTPVTATVQQLCPSWNSSGVGYERIEEESGGNYPFGFSWDMVAIFNYSKITNPGYNYLKNQATALKSSSNASYYSVTTPSSSTITATIDYKNAFSLGKSTTDGLVNTKELFLNPNEEGFQDAIELDEKVDDIIYIISTFTRTSSGGEFQTASNYAARMAVMKNKFTKQTLSDGTEVPKIAESDIKWYLPAINEQSSLTDDTYPLSGDYWSSTTALGNSSYSYNGSSVSTTTRLTNCKIRAARRKP